MLPYRDGRITKIILALFFVLVALYAYYEARGLLFGPTIDVPKGASVVHDRFVTIRGNATRIARLTMNGKPVTVTEEGAFEEPYLLNNGYNRIVLRAEDKYGRARESVVEVMYEPMSLTSTGQATQSADSGQATKSADSGQATKSADSGQATKSADSHVNGPPAEIAPSASSTPSY